MLTPEELQYYKREYNLAGQPDFLVEMNRHCSLEGKRVLEVGGSNIPKQFLFEELKVRQWVSVDRVYAENRKYWPKQYRHTGVIPISEDIDYRDRKSTRLNSSHLGISYAVFCLKKKY